MEQDYSFNRNRASSSFSSSPYDPQPHIPMYRATNPNSNSNSNYNNNNNTSSLYPNLGHPVTSPTARPPPYTSTSNTINNNINSSPPLSSSGIRVQIKPEFRITQPPQLLPQMGEIPRSSFQYDFSLERKVLAEAEKGNPNWSRFAAENLPSRMAEPTPSIPSVAPSVDPVVRKYITSGLNREAVPLAVANYGDNPAKVQEFANAFTLLREMGFSSNAVGEALLMHDNDTDKALAHFLNNSS